MGGIPPFFSRFGSCVPFLRHGLCHPFFVFNQHLHPATATIQMSKMQWGNPNIYKNGVKGGGICNLTSVLALLITTSVWPMFILHGI